MKKSIVLIGGILLLTVICSSARPKEEPIHQRGWIGGEYKLVTEFPVGFSNAPKAAVLITSLNTNTPASLAGLNEGDLILEVNHQPATKLSRVWDRIDHSEPGALLAVKVWHDGQIDEHEIRVGRETYRNNGVFMVGVPGFFHPLKLWPFASFSAGFSVGVAGFKPGPVAKRKELNSAEERYFRSCNPKNYRSVDEGWRAWLVIMQAETNKRIQSQEVYPASGS